MYMHQLLVEKGELRAILFRPCFGGEVFTVATLQTINNRRVADVTLWPISALESALICSVGTKASSKSMNQHRARTCKTK